jgi:6,7-dimethyl-8-ribityllumazine synthase
MTIHKGKLDGAGLRVGVVASRFNSAVTERLLDGALEALHSHGLGQDDIEVVRVPGAFEIPVAARWLADRGRLDAIVCVGAVVRGETPHFEYIAAAAVSEICRLSVETGLPIALGVLTTNDIEQALARAGAGHGNKGHEAAVTAIEMANVRRLLKD